MPSAAHGATFGANCAPIPEPFLWNPEFDVDHDTINREHNDLMKAVNIVAMNIFDLGAIDDLYEKLRSHFSHEEQIMDDLLMQQRQLLQEYEVISHTEQDSVSTFDSLASSVGDDPVSSFRDSEGLSDVESRLSRPKVPDDHYRTFDPIFDAEITIWPGTLVGETVRVDIRDYVLTPKGVESHKMKHAILLEDCLVVRRRAVRALHAAEQKLTAPQGGRGDPYNGNSIGAVEVSFLRNWYTQHVKTEDMSIKHSVMLIRKLKQVIEARTQMSLSHGKSLSHALSNAPVSSEGSVSIKPLAKAFKPASQKRIKSSASLSSLSSVSTGDSLRDYIAYESESGVLMARQWLMTVQQGSMCGLLLLRPPGGAHKSIRMVMGSLTWSLMSGYDPWDVAGLDFGPLIGSRKSGDLMLQLQRWCLELRRADGDEKREDLPSCMMLTTSFVHREGFRVPSLLVLMPVLVRSYYMVSKKMTLLAFFFRSFHSMQTCESTTPDVLTIAHARQQCFMSRKTARWSPVQEDSARAVQERIGGRSAVVGGFQEDWKFLPITNIYFREAVERICSTLLRNGFVTAELGVQTVRYPCRAMLRQRKATRIKVLNMIRDLMYSKRAERREPVEMAAANDPSSADTAGSAAEESRAANLDDGCLRLRSLDIDFGRSSPPMRTASAASSPPSLELGTRETPARAGSNIEPRRRVREGSATATSVKEPIPRKLHKTETRRVKKKKRESAAPKRSLWEELGLRRMPPPTASKEKRKKASKDGSRAPKKFRMSPKQRSPTIHRRFSGAEST